MRTDLWVSWNEDEYFLDAVKHPNVEEAIEVFADLEGITVVSWVQNYPQPTKEVLPMCMGGDGDHNFEQPDECEFCEDTLVWRSNPSMS